MVLVTRYPVLFLLVFYVTLGVCFKFLVLSYLCGLNFLIMLGDLN